MRDIPRSGIRDFFEIVTEHERCDLAGNRRARLCDAVAHPRSGDLLPRERGRPDTVPILASRGFAAPLASYVADHFGVQYEPLGEVLVSVGVSEAIDLALRAILNPGDEVLYHEPCYVSYGPSVVLARGVARPIPTRAADHFVLRAEALERAVTPRSKVLMLNFPNNPTGATMPAEELERIAAVCIKHDLTVLSDEIYSELTYDAAPSPSMASLPGMRERTILLHGVSKAYAMTGWRIGFACAPQPVIEAMMKIHQYAILCAPIMGQEAAIEALERGEQSMLAMRREYELRRNYIVRAFNDLGLECFKPRGAFYVFPRISSTGLTSREFSLQLLREKKVAVVPGTAFGPSGEGHVRCSYATGLSQIKVAAERIGEFCTELNSRRAAA